MHLSNVVSMVTARINSVTFLRNLCKLYNGNSCAQNQINPLGLEVAMGDMIFFSSHWLLPHTTIMERMVRDVKGK